MTSQCFYVFFTSHKRNIISKTIDKLIKKGHFANISGSLQESIEIFKSEKKVPDILFYDITDENDFADDIFKLKEQNNNLEIVVLSNKRSTKFAIKAISLGAYGYIDIEIISNIDPIEALCNKIFEKLKLKNQYVNILKRLEEEEEEYKKKVIEIDNKREQLKRLNAVILKSQLEAEQRLVFSSTLYSLTEPKAVLKASCDLLATFNEEIIFLIFELDKINLKLIGVSNDTNNTETSGIRIDLPKDYDSLNHKTLLDNITIYTDFEKIIEACFNTKNFSHKTMMFSNNTPFGIFVMISEKNIKLELDETLTLISRAYENAVMRQEINMMAIKDGLTGLYNQKHFKTELEKEIKKSIRYKYPLSLLFFDIDDFKQFNDLNGHQIGDEVLKKLAAIINQNTRDIDIASSGFSDIILNDQQGKDFSKDELFVSRYGGEEFAIILPYTDIKGANIVGERIRSMVEKEDFPCQEKQPQGTLTISMGISERNSIVKNAKFMILVADAALYQSKKNGKNLVSSLSEESVKIIIEKGKLDL